MSQIFVGKRDMLKRLQLFFIGYLVILGTIGVVVEAFDDAPTLDPQIPTQSPHKAPTSDSCVGQCAFQFVDELTTNLGPGKSAGLLNLNYNDFLTAFSNQTFFETFCKLVFVNPKSLDRKSKKSLNYAFRLYHGFQFCYTKCSPGYMQELLQRSSEIIDHFCVYNYQGKEVLCVYLTMVMVLSFILHGFCCCQKLD